MKARMAVYIPFTQGFGRALARGLSRASKASANLVSKLLGHAGIDVLFDRKEANRNRSQIARVYIHGDLSCLAIAAR